MSEAFPLRLWQERQNSSFALERSVVPFLPCPLWQALHPALTFVLSRCVGGAPEEDRGNVNKERGNRRKKNNSSAANFLRRHIPIVISFSIHTICTLSLMGMALRSYQYGTRCITDHDHSGRRFSGRPILPEEGPHEHHDRCCTVSLHPRACRQSGCLSSRDAPVNPPAVCIS